MFQPCWNRDSVKCVLITFKVLILSCNDCMPCLSPQPFLIDVRKTSAPRVVVDTLMSSASFGTLDLLDVALTSLQVTSFKTTCCKCFASQPWRSQPPPAQMTSAPKRSRCSKPLRPSKWKVGPLPYVSCLTVVVDCVLGQYGPGNVPGDPDSKKGYLDDKTVPKVLILVSPTPPQLSS